MPPVHPFCKACKAKKRFVGMAGDGVRMCCPICGKETVSYAKSAYKIAERALKEASSGKSE